MSSISEASIELCPGLVRGPPVGFQAVNIILARILLARNCGCSAQLLATASHSDAEVARNASCHHLAGWHRATVC